MSKFTTQIGKDFGPPVPEIDWSWLMTKMTEAPSTRELKSMSDVEKKVNVGVKQHDVRTCTLEQKTRRREMNGESDFS